MLPFASVGPILSRVTMVTDHLSIFVSNHLDGWSSVCTVRLFYFFKEKLPAEIICFVKHLLCIIFPIFLLTCTQFPTNSALLKHQNQILNTKHTSSYRYMSHLFIILIVQYCLKVFQGCITSAGYFVFLDKIIFLQMTIV